MLIAREILGDAYAEPYADRRTERLIVTWADATKPRLRIQTDAGTDVAIQLDRGSFLDDGAVIHDDGERIIVVERALEKTMVIRLDPGLDPAETVRQAVDVGHAFGNQHVPIEVDSGEIRVPVTTSEEILLATATSLGLNGADISFVSMKLGCARPLGARGHRNHRE